MANKERDLSSVDKELLETLKLFLKSEADAVTLDSLIKDDLGIDSVDALDLIFVLEKQFKIELLEESMVEIKSVRDLRNVISRRLVVNKRVINRSED